MRRPTRAEHRSVPGTAGSLLDLRLVKVAAEVVARSSRDLPADRALRETLKARRDAPPSDSPQISRAVFAYFRWYRWLDLAQPVAKQLDAALELAARYASHPQEFTEAELRSRAVPEWTSSEMEVAVAWLRALQAEPRLWLRARPGTGAALIASLGAGTPAGEGPLADCISYAGRQDLFRTMSFHAGEFELQDITSQAVGLACDPQPGETWWDVCAGEGGKTLHLADLMKNRGLIWSTDRAAWRLAVLKRRASRAKLFNYRARPWNGFAPLPTRTRFDGVLVDAPCSGIGTWGRNPHARWTSTPADVQELSGVQKELLSLVATTVKPGGKLIYSVCSLSRSETVAVATEFDRAQPEFRRLPLMNPLEAKAAAEPELWLRPELTGGNGMFVAAWRRAK